MCFISLDIIYLLQLFQKEVPSSPVFTAEHVQSAPGLPLGIYTNHQRQGCSATRYTLTIYTNHQRQSCSATRYTVTIYTNHQRQGCSATRYTVTIYTNHQRQGCSATRYTLCAAVPLKGQSNEIFDQQFFSSFEPALATGQWVKKNSNLVKNSQSYLNFKPENLTPRGIIPRRVNKKSAKT